VDTGQVGLRLSGYRTSRVETASGYRTSRVETASGYRTSRVETEWIQGK